MLDAGRLVGITFGYLAGALLMVPLFVMMILPFLNGAFDSANLANTITATDPATFLGVASVILLVTLLAAWAPAARAMRVDPAGTLRAE